MLKISLDTVNDLQNVFFEIAAITYLQNVTRDENAENSFYVHGFEFLKGEAAAFLLDKQTDAVLKMKELLFKDEFNTGE